MGNPRDARLRIVGEDDTLAATRSAARNLTALEKKADSVAKSGKSMGSKFKAGIQAMAPSALAAGAALAKLGFDAIKNASAAEQSIGATQTVFGKYADSIIAKSKDERDNVRLTASEYREAANLIGAGFKNQGVAGDKLAAKTKDMIQVGADLAATYGGSTKEAVEALGSAFKGEFDPIERYGIGLSAAKISAEAFNVAGVRTQAEFSKLSAKSQALAKQQATTNLITKQSGEAIGAAGREAGTTAAQVEAAKEKYGNLSAQLGSKLLPIVNKVLSAGIKLTSWAAKHKTVVYAAAAAVGVLTTGVLLLNLAFLANPVGLVIVGIAALTAAFVAAYRKSETFRTVVNAVFKAVANVILGAVSAIIRVFEALFGVLGHLPGKAGKAFRTAAASAKTARQAVDNLRASINRLGNKSVYINVYTVEHRKKQLAAGRGDTLTSAAGGTFDRIAPGYTGRTGGPQQVTLANTTTVDARVYLDSNVLRSVARTVVRDQSTSDAHRARVGTRR